MRVTRHQLVTYRVGRDRALCIACAAWTRAAAGPNNRPRSAELGKHAVSVLSDSTVIVTGLDTVTSVRDGVRTSANGRVTFVIARRGADWQIVHFHRSALPD